MSSTPQPVNTKSLLAHIFGVMKQLSDNEITPEEACAQAKLASQACNLLNYELKTTLVKLKLREAGANINISDCNIRQIESKPFRNTMNYEGENAECQDYFEL